MLTDLDVDSFYLFFFFFIYSSLVVAQYVCTNVLKWQLHHFKFRNEHSDKNITLNQRKQTCSFNAQHYHCLLESLLWFFKIILLMLLLTRIKETNCYAFYFDRV